MERLVKGTIFTDYVRMIRSRKDIDWLEHLSQDDLDFIHDMILSSSWYPLETYKRIGLAVFNIIARGETRIAWLWGRASLNELVEIYKNMVLPQDPIGTIHKFSDFRNRFLNFEWMEMKELAPNQVHVVFNLVFDDDADRAYAYQFGGILERMMELAEAEDIKVDFHKKCWDGDPNTIFEINWK